MEVVIVSFVVVVVDVVVVIVVVGTWRAWKQRDGKQVRDFRRFGHVT